jgi:hypothetical protein
MASFSGFSTDPISSPTDHAPKILALRAASICPVRSHILKFFMGGRMENLDLMEKAPMAIQIDRV